MSAIQRMKVSHKDRVGKSAENIGEARLIAVIGGRRLWRSNT